MRLTTLEKNETSLSALAERIYPNLSEASRRKAIAALHKANPHLASIDALRPGVVVHLPADSGFVPRPGTAGKDPVDEALGELKAAVSSYHDDLVKRLDESIEDAARQEEILKQREIAAAIKAAPGAAELAKSLAANLRERRKQDEERKKAHDKTFAMIAGDIGSLLD